MTAVLLLEHGNRPTAALKVDKSTEKTTRFVWETLDGLVNPFENSLQDYYFNWLSSCLLVGACWHPLLNTLRAILKKACCTAS